MGTEQRVRSNPEVGPGFRKSNPEVLIMMGTDNKEMADMQTEQMVGFSAEIGLWVGNMKPRVCKGVGVVSRAVSEDSIDMEVSIIENRLGITHTVSANLCQKFENWEGVGGDE